MKSPFIETLELHVELHEVIETAVDNGALEPKALELMNRIIALYRAPLSLNIHQAKAKLGVLYRARNLLDAFANKRQQKLEEPE